MFGHTSIHVNTSKGYRAEIVHQKSSGNLTAMEVSKDEAGKVQKAPMQTVKEAAQDEECSI